MLAIIHVTRADEHHLQTAMKNKRLGELRERQ